jgi:hypothetical protein
MDKPTAEDYQYSKKFLNKHPAVKKKVQQAIKNDWTPQRLATEIKKTPWYRNLDRDQKRWSTITVEEPAEAKAMVNENKRVLRQMARVQGIALTGSEVQKMATNAARNGWDEIEMRAAIARKMDRKDMTGGPMGDVDNLDEAINERVHQYMVRVDNPTRVKWAKQIARGDMQMEDIDTYFDRQAQRMFSGVADDLRAGMTTRDIMSPYLQTAADELGITLGSVNLFDSKWTAALSGGEKGKALSLEEWQEKIRTENRYGYKDSRKAKNEAASMAQGILGIFGMR